MGRVRGLLTLGLLHSASADFEAPKYEVDLDLPASNRWTPIVKDIIEKHGWEGSYASVADYLTKTVAPIAKFQQLDVVIQAGGLALFGLEYLEELRGVSALITQLGYGDKMTTGMLVFLQVFYEFVMECTGIVARDPKGQVTHGRNMDIDLILPNITADVDWIRGGQLIATSTQYIGYMGVHTGMRQGRGWSVQANHREVMELGPWGWEKSVLAHNALALIRKYNSVGFFLRELLLNTPSFEEAVVQLSSAKIDSPLYFIVAGPQPDQGAVITRTREGLAPSPHNTSVSALHGSESWYRVQTNWDNWMPITQEQCRGTVEALPQYAEEACSEVTKLAYGDSRGCAVLCNMTSDGRREEALARMELLTSAQVSFASISGVLSKAPVLAPNTAFTTLMRPASDEYKTVVREHGRDKLVARAAAASKKWASLGEGLLLDMMKASGLQLNDRILV